MFTFFVSVLSLIYFLGSGRAQSYPCLVGSFGSGQYHQSSTGVYYLHGGLFSGCNGQASTIRIKIMRNLLVNSQDRVCFTVRLFQYASGSGGNTLYRSPENLALIGQCINNGNLIDGSGSLSGHSFVELPVSWPVSSNDVLGVVTTSGQTAIVHFIGSQSSYVANQAAVNQFNTELFSLGPFTSTNQIALEVDITSGGTLSPSSNPSSNPSPNPSSNPLPNPPQNATPSATPGSPSVLSTVIPIVVTLCVIATTAVVAIVILVIWWRRKGSPFKHIFTSNGVNAYVSSVPQNHANLITTKKLDVYYSTVGAENTITGDPVNKAIEPFPYTIPSDPKESTIYEEIGFLKSEELYSEPYISVEDTADDHEDHYEREEGPVDIYWTPPTREKELYAVFEGKKISKIHREDIKLQQKIGEGQFGKVMVGVWRRDDSEVLVAVKTLKAETSDENCVRFLQEAAIMGQFYHSSIVKMHGLVLEGQPLLIVLEMMANGDLCSYLKGIKERSIHQESLQTKLLHFSRQISAGMNYLSNKGFIHRDLAARNVLMPDEETCKIGDFGMSRDLISDDYYVSQGGKVPVRWTALEALMFNHFSTASDVWSFGVVLYELWSLGATPYTSLKPVEVVRSVKNGERLPPPPGCPSWIYQLMIECWHPVGRKRPRFSTILFLLQQDNDMASFGKLGDSLESTCELFIDLQTVYMCKA